MMKLITTLLAIAFSFQLTAQMTIEKEVKLLKSKKININLPYAKSIDLQSWPNNYILIKAVVSIQDGDLNHQYSLNVKEQKNSIDLSSNYGTLFSKKQGLLNLFRNRDMSTTIKLGKSEGREDVVIDGISVKVIYTISIPHDNMVTLESNSGNLNISHFEGELTGNITSGDVAVKKYRGNVSLTTVSGNIDFKVSDTSNLNAKATLGKIIKESPISSLLIGEKRIGSFATRQLKDADEDVQLSTTIGTIKLRE